MNKIPFILGVTTLFWGWQTGSIWLSIFMASTIELGRVLPFKGEFSQKNFNQISDVSTLLTIFTFFYLYTSGNDLIFLKFIKWLPILLFPLIGLQIFSYYNKIDIKPLFRLYRSKKSLNSKPYKVDITVPYFAILILSSSVENKDQNFYLFFSIIIFLALLLSRPKRGSLPLFITLFIVVASSGYTIHTGIILAQNYLIEQMGFSQFFNPLKGKTSIGSMRGLKFSNKIMFRVKPLDNHIPHYVRESIFHYYADGEWLAKYKAPIKIFPDETDLNWRLNSCKNCDVNRAKFYISLYRNRGVLKYPTGSYLIKNMRIGKLEKLNGYQISKGDSTISYTAYYDHNKIFENKPGSHDLVVLKKYKKILEKVARYLNLKNISKERAVKRVIQYFHNHFYYSLKQSKPPEGVDPIEHFLLNSHYGHCEFYATATVLLLRTIGIPARYVTGYVVDEYSKFEDLYLVRDKHGHAWVELYLNGKWIEIDTTPSTWLNYGEQKAGSSWRVIADFLSWLNFRFYLWKEGVNFKDFLYYLLAILIIIFGWRVFKGGKKQDKKKGKWRFNWFTIKNIFRSKDLTALYKIERKLDKLGYPRYHHETFLNWLDRLKDELGERGELNDLEVIIKKYYSYKFDPQNSESVETIYSLVDNWMKKHKKIVLKDKK